MKPCLTVALLVIVFTNSFAQSTKATEKDKLPTPEELGIVIINAGSLDRSGIADLINKVNRDKPLVVGVNFTFEEKKEGDEKLIAALNATGKLVMNCHEDAGILYKSYFEGLDYGQCNLRRNHRGEVDYFPPMLEVNGERIEHFAMKVLQYRDPGKYKVLHDELKSLSHHRVTFMKIDYLPENYRSFETLDQSVITKAKPGFFDNKIVLIGYLGEKLSGEKFVTEEEDAFQIPLAHHHHERNPMYATVILANIIQTLIRGELRSFHHE